MKIVIFSAYYWPEYAGTAPYITAPAEHLASIGHEVHVAAAYPHYPEWRALEPRRFANRETHNGVTVHRRWHTIPSQQNAKSRGVYEASMFTTGLTQFAALPRPDVIIGVSPALSSAMLARLASRIYRCPYGLIIHDLFGKGAEQTGMGGGRVGQMLNRIEGGVARRASRLLVLTDAFADFFAASGFDRDRIDVVPPWSLRERPTIDRDAVRNRLGWKPDEFACVHAGNMGQKQGLENIVEAARLLAVRNDRAIRIVMAGDGHERARLESISTSLGLKNIEFTGGLSDREYDEVICAADVLLLNQRPSVSDMSLPSKMTAYFAARKPVIAAVANESAAAQTMRAADAGPIIDPADSEALASALVDLSQQPRLLEEMGDRAHTYADDHLSAAATLPQYARFVDHLIERRRGSTQA